MRKFKELYGAGPLNLLGHAIVIGIAAWALSIMFRAPFAPQPLNLILWLLGGAIIHDLVFLPAYSAVNVVATKVFKGSPSINYVRVPVIVSGILLLAFLPRIANRQPQNFERALGHAPPDYLTRWLLITALLFVASLLIWGGRRLSGRTRPMPAVASEDGAAASRLQERQVLAPSCLRSMSREIP